MVSSKLVEVTITLDISSFAAAMERLRREVADHFPAAEEMADDE